MKSTALISALGIGALLLAGSTVYAQNSNGQSTTSQTTHITKTIQTSQSSQNPALTSSERHFIHSLARANVAEIETGRVAQQKATTPMVKDLANKMVADHTRLNDQLKAWAMQHHVSVPTQPSKWEIDQKAKLDRLSGTAFDRAYVDTMLSDHRHDIRQVQHMAEHASSPAVRQLAASVLPTLENHVRIAENDAGALHIPSGKGLNRTGTAARTAGQ